MDFLGLHYAIWIVLVLYFIGMLLMGWWSKRGAHSQEGYLLGNRRFGVWMMIMHAFGAGTHPGNVAGVMSEATVSGASGIWVSWMWLFGTPFYWLIAPVIRRMRCLTMADYYQERFGKAASLLYIFVAAVGMIVFLAGVLLATTRTVQGMMDKTVVEKTSQVTAQQTTTSSLAADKQEGTDASWFYRAWQTVRRDPWFFGILVVSTAVFIVYSYWGGIIAAIRTDMIQGLMIIALSFIAIPAALRLNEVGGLAGMRETLAAQTSSGVDYLRLFNPNKFNWLTVLLLTINAPLTALAFPHLMSVCAAGRTEWEGRVGFTYGNILKRVCTIGWVVLGLCWVAYLIKTGSEIHKDAAFGNSIRTLLPPVLQGVMLACVMAASMSSGDAVQVTVAGLFSQNIYRTYVNPNANEKQLVRVTRMVGVGVALLALVGAILMRHSLVKAILDYFNILSLVGISTAMGLLWRRMNSTGMICSTVAASTVFILTGYIISWSEADLVQQGILAVNEGVRTWGTGAGLLRSLSEAGVLGWTGSGSEVKLAFTRLTTIAAPLLTGVVSGVIGSLATKAPRPEVIENFFKKIYVPIGQEDKLELPLDEAVPDSQRWITAGGLFLVKPSRQSWVGFVVTLGICVACVLVMLALLR